MWLKDRSIVVTGASSGLGLAMASEFVVEGADVVCSSFEENELRRTVDELNSRGLGRAIAITADVREWEAVRELMAETVDQLGKLDVLVNNAGVTQLHATEENERYPVVDLPVGAWERILDTNLTGVFYCSKAALPYMLGRGSGRVMHVTSGNGVRGRPNRSPYCASKFGLEGFHESLSRELEGTGVDSIAFRPPPGGVYSERYGKIGRTPESFTFQSPDIIVETAVRLASGEGENGGRYVATEDGADYVEYTRSDLVDS